MRLSASLADQGRSGYQRGSEAWSSLLGTAICGSRLSVHPAAKGTAVRARAAAAAVVRRGGRAFRFIGEIVPELCGRRKFAADGRLRWGGGVAKRRRGSSLAVRLQPIDLGPERVHVDDQPRAAGDRIDGSLRGGGRVRVAPVGPQLE